MRIVYHLITKDIVAAINDDSTVTNYPSLDYGIVQGDIDTIERVVAALELDPTKIPDIGMNNTLKRVYKDRLMGQRLFNRFLSENKQIDISTEQNIQQLSMLINIKLMLDAGALTTARDMLTQVPGGAFLVTPGYSTGDERKQSYIDEINTYINSNPPV